MVREHLHPDNFGLWLQLVMLGLTFLGILHYRWYFGARMRAREKGGKVEKTNLITLNLFSGSNTIIWFIMPFLPQPRFMGLWHVVVYGDSVSWIGLCTSIVGVGIVLFSALWFIRVQTENLKVTKEDYTAPNELLTQGGYKKIRHPITVTGGLLVMGFCLATGSYYTTILFPVWLVQLHILVLIEEKYALGPRFGDAFLKYKKSIPRYVSALSVSMFFSGLSAMIADFLFVNILY
ncbi:MAG: hypothetical protein MI684_02515 [Chlorobiales bacterium]|nr:hypothetical protein [Chlorobiales bacterium]